MLFHGSMDRNGSEIFILLLLGFFLPSWLERAVFRNPIRSCNYICVKHDSRKQTHWQWKQWIFQIIFFIWTRWRLFCSCSLFKESVICATIFFHVSRNTKKKRPCWFQGGILLKKYSFVAVAKIENIYENIYMVKNNVVMFGSDSVGFMVFVLLPFCQ